MSNLLISEPPLQVLPSLACKVGLNEAIILQQFHYWLQRSNNIKDGYKWIYNSYSEWHKQFPFWKSKNTLISAIKRLENMGILISGNYNKAKFDKTKWYRIDYQKLESLKKSQPCTKNWYMDGQELVDGTTKNNQTNTNRLPEITSENTNNSKNKKLSTSSLEEKDNKLGCYVTDFYEKNIGFLAPTLREDIEYEIEEWNQINPEESEKIIVEALKNAIGAQASNKWKYARSILNSWKEKNIKSLSDIEADDIEHRKKMELKYGKKKSYMRKPREEKMPYWFDDKNNNQVEKDQESKKETRAEINKLMEKINGDGSNG